MFTDVIFRISSIRVSSERLQITFFLKVFPSFLKLQFTYDFLIKTHYSAYDYMSYDNLKILTTRYYLTDNYIGQIRKVWILLEKPLTLRDMHIEIFNAAYASLHEKAFHIVKTW